MKLDRRRAGPGSDSRAEGDRHMLVRRPGSSDPLRALRAPLEHGAHSLGGGIRGRPSRSTRTRAGRRGGRRARTRRGLADPPWAGSVRRGFGPDPIRHAFRVTVRRTNGYAGSWRASHRAGDTAGARPMGARLRLKASKDLNGYPEPIRKIFEAMQDPWSDRRRQRDPTCTSPEHTMSGGTTTFSIQRSGGPKASDFEVIELGGQPAPSLVLASGPALALFDCTRRRTHSGWPQRFGEPLVATTRA